MTDEQKKLKAERDRRYREKKKALEQKPNDPWKHSFALNTDFAAHCCHSCCHLE